MKPPLPVSLFLLSSVCGVAMAQSGPTNDVLESVKGRYFKLSDPVGCVVWTDVAGQQKRFRNQCTFRVEVVACGVGADRRDCGASLDQLKYSSTTLDPHPPKPGNYGTEYSVHSGTTPFPTVTGVVACPVGRFPQANEGKPFQIWQLEKTGGLLSGKCLTPYDGSPQKSKVKTIPWPYYSGAPYQSNVMVQVVQD